MKKKLNKTVLFATLILLCGIGFTSCRGGSAKKAAQLVEKYGGKLIKKVRRQRFCNIATMSLAKSALSL